jgi:hypothetical protein
VEEDSIEGDFMAILEAINYLDRTIFTSNNLDGGIANVIYQSLE